MKKLLLIAGVLLAGGPRARATLPVIDYTAILHAVYSQGFNSLQYVEQTLQQIQQVENSYQQIMNQYTQIEGMYDQLRRFGDPSYYVNLLNLSDYTASASNLTRGVGNTVAQFEQAADGVTSLAYTANGLYADLSHTVDRFGNAVNYSTGAFRKFDAVAEGARAYDQQLTVYDQQMAALTQQLTQATAAMNADRTQEGRARYHGLIDGIHAQMDALHAQTYLAGQRVQVQAIKNANDAARTQEAARQQLEQERNESLQGMADNFSGLVHGGAN